MDMKHVVAAVALAIAASACSQGDSDNVMAPEANALEPAQVDAVLGPEGSVAGGADRNTDGIDLTPNEVDTNAASSASDNAADEAGAGNSGE